ncbi:hypothetical protein KY338_03765 [Candidatus Woesearchaeota archaeon]|nr:hypothetical protein [Candidatus Woesearchaeota archaeon]MBW3005429.1 hypothetical protein [Candidatus Woesearchaeota archaeon]
MGKKKNNKKKKNNIVEPLQETPEKIDHRRRKLLKYGLGSLLLIAAGGTGLPILARMVQGEEDKWDFMHAPNMSCNDPRYDIKYARDHKGLYVPVGEPYKVPPAEAEQEFARVREKVMTRAREENWKDLTITVWRQNFARVDDRPGRAKHFKKYLEIAANFLYTRLPNLPKTGIDFVVLKPGDDFTKNANCKGLVGLMNHKVYTVACEDKITGKYAEAELYHNDQGSFTHQNHDLRTNKYDNWIVFGSAAAVIQAPFSELIPYALLMQNTRLTEEREYQTISVMVEAISEGLSYLLSEQIVDMLNIPNGRNILKQDLESMLNNRPQIYSQVRNSINWLRQNGMQKGLDIYLKNPDRFMQKIKNA